MHITERARDLVANNAKTIGAFLLSVLSLTAVPRCKTQSIIFYRTEKNPIFSSIIQNKIFSLAHINSLTYINGEKKCRTKRMQKKPVQLS